MEKYTVVIPVRNSIETLRYTLRTCLEQTYPAFEIIISDNCSTDGTREWINSINDNRIKYYQTPRSLSMTENFEFALSKATEGFIMCIGADDGLMPGAIEYVDGIVAKYHAKAVACQYAHYFWPNVPIAEHGRLVLNALGVYSSETEIRNSGEWIKKTLAYQTQLYVCDLPSLYYGFVHRSIIDKAVKDGQYFRSITPDAFSAFATAVHIDSYAYSYRPFSIAGISGKSNGLSQTIGSDISKTFVTENAHPIHRDFIFCTAMEVIMGEAYSQLADAFPDACRPYPLDFRLMCKNAVLNANAQMYPQVIEAVTKMAELHKLDAAAFKKSKVEKWKKFFRRSLRMFSDVIFKGGKILGMKDSEKFGVRNVYDASIVLSILESSNRGQKITTVRGRFWSRFKKRIFFQSNDTM